MNILLSIGKYIPLTKEEGDYFLSLLAHKTLDQGDFIEKPEETTRHFIHVMSGCLMTYYSDKQAADHVVQFATANWWTGDLNSFIKQLPSSYSTRALSNSEVILLPKTHFDDLLEKHPIFEKYFRTIFQNSLITHQHRILQNISSTAEERYLLFQKKYPSLEQFAPLKYIASFLGMTPEFLSKIRRRLMDR
jgi:CRP-like cAMP-binding protein